MFAIKNIIILVLKSLLISFIVISITTVSIFFLSKKITQISTSIEEANKQKADFTKRVNISEIIKKDVTTIGTNNVNIENAFMSSSNISNFINNIDNIGKKNNILQMYKFSTPVSSEFTTTSFGISSISYTNNFTNNISGFLTYLKEFEGLPYFTKINSFSISSQETTGLQGLSQIAFTADLYVKTQQ